MRHIAAGFIFGSACIALSLAAGLSVELTNWLGIGYYAIGSIGWLAITGKP